MATTRNRSNRDASGKKVQEAQFRQVRAVMIGWAMVLRQLCADAPINMDPTQRSVFHDSDKNPLPEVMEIGNLLSQVFTKWTDALKFIIEFIPPVDQGELVYAWEPIWRPLGI